MATGDRRMNRGRLQLERERFDLGPEYRLPPPKSVHPMSEVMPDVLKGMGLESQAKVADLQPRWEEIVGRANARHSRPGEWEKGVLTVYVDHNVWLAELKRFAAKAILKRVRAMYGEKAVRELRFQIDPGEDL